ncbi:uncharacterized protein LOC108036443 [Drosophila biarmipes]|uniref:uncharacterized protein LOC108036443 n=1 Tax=Drosophila biarmipes TaxID=125945 RepID=UPI0007E6AE87|nr:uncharacterized protein LOC108036443 [Drosophila biarmipes]
MFCLLQVHTKRKQMSLVADYSDSSESDGESSSLSSEDEEPKPAPPTEKPPPKLPSASQALSQGAGKGDVFSNPFLEAELHKTASLERHVKMVDNDAHLQLKNGRKICWNFRRGRCRFGTSCQYAHDSDLSVDDAAEKSAVPVPSVAVVMTAATGQPNKRKRPGLGDALQPGKRVMKSYMQQNPQNPFSRR